MIQRAQIFSNCVVVNYITIDRSEPALFCIRLGVIFMSFRGPQALKDRKGSSESILTSSLAGDIARYRLKRRQRYRWAGLLSFEKPMEQDADSIPSGGRQHDNHTKREWIARSCVVLEPAHAEKQHAREPGDLLHVLVS